jgi:hypothetical protein
VSKAILVVERITRIGNKSLGELFLTDDVVASEAAMGRGLLIGACREERFISHICYALRNALPSKSVVVAFSYALSEEIAEKLRLEHNLIVWQAIRNRRRGKGNDMAPIQIGVPEKLYILDRRVRNEDYDPSFIHVVDPDASLVRANFSYDGVVTYRPSNVARHKAICEANGSTPYVLFWTKESCGSLMASHLCQVAGLDAWLYANGRTLRTAAFTD